MSKNRSGCSVIQSLLDIKRWQHRLPTVDEVRPGRCPFCEAAGSPVGGRLQLHGHGTRERQVCGPDAPGAPPVILLVTARRYRCVSCRAVLIVVPREVRARRLYSASAIGFALALWGLAQATTIEVRRKISPAKILGDTAFGGWATLRRWAREAAHGRLFPWAPDPGPSASLRRVAASAAQALAARADPTTRGLSLEHRAFLGAAHAA
jgi:hypothetical protein